jgi:hypothetical protein
VILDHDHTPDEWVSSGPYRTGAFVMGPVKGWGRAVPHDFGWRAEYAKPLGFYELTIPPRPKDGLAKLWVSHGDLFVWEPDYFRSPLIALSERYAVPRLIPPSDLRKRIWPW